MGSRTLWGWARTASTDCWSLERFLAGDDEAEDGLGRLLGPAAAGIEGLGRARLTGAGRVTVVTGTARAGPSGVPKNERGAAMALVGS